MKVTLLQQDIVWGDAQANCVVAEAAIRQAPRCDLFILPEMWSTGFATQPEGIAEDDGQSLAWMQRMADEMDAAVAGSVAVCEDGRYYNRFYFVKPRSLEASKSRNFETSEFCVEHYDKHHLFTYGGEHLNYTAGDNRVVVEWCGVRFLLQVCYDLRFPVWARNNEDYDAIIYVASWPSTRRAVWDALLMARAIENQCYVLGVNRVGSDPVCQYNGGTVVIDAYGHTVAACADGEVQTVTAELDMARLDVFRKKFPVLGDRDLYIITK